MVRELDDPPAEIPEQVWNVLVPVVELVKGRFADGNEAIDALRDALRAAGFEPYEGGGRWLPDAYVSEDQETLMADFQEKVLGIDTSVTAGQYRLLRPRS